MGGSSSTQHGGGRGEAWPPVVISTIMVTMISTIGGHADKRQPSEGELLQRAPHHHHHLSHTFPSWSDETEERRLVEEEGSKTKKTWMQKKEDPKERVSSCPGPLSF